jgi:membrane protein
MRSPTKWPWVKRLLGLRWVRLGLAVQKRGGEDAVGPRAAALAFFAFLSLFPLLLVGLSVIGSFLSPKDTAEIVRSVAETVPGLEGIVDRNLRILLRSGATIGILGLIGLAWTASGAASSARQALADVFRTPKPNILHGRLEPFGIMVLLGLIGVVSIAVTTTASSWSSGGPLGVVIRVLALLLTMGIDFGFLSLAYWLLTPRGGPKWAEHAPGAILMTIAWTAIKVLGSWYATRVVVRSSALYGAIGGVFGLLIILQLTATAFLYCAELTAVLLEEPGGRRRTATSRNKTTGVDGTTGSP